jgi:hypothetical protein
MMQVAVAPLAIPTFSHSTGNSTNDSDVTTCQHTLRTKALKSIELSNRNYMLENNLVDTLDKMAMIIVKNLLLQEQLTALTQATV